MRIIPVRNISWWLAIIASLGMSRNVLRKNSETFIYIDYNEKSEALQVLGDMVGDFADDTLQGTTVRSFRITSSFLQNKITYIATKSIRKFARALNSDASFARFHERDV